MSDLRMPPMQPPPYQRLPVSMIRKTAKTQPADECLLGKCGHDKQSRYIRVSLEGGGTYLQPFDQIHHAIDGEFDGGDADPGVKLTLELVEMPQCEYECLPEFDGH